MVDFQRPIRATVDGLGLERKLFSNFGRNGSYFRELTMPEVSMLMCPVLLAFVPALVACIASLPAEVQPPYLGVSSLPTEHGAEITRVVPGSPADQAGIVAGDMVRQRRRLSGRT